MREPSLLRRTVLATSLALSLTGLSASVEVAEAMPASPTLAQAGDAGALTAVQYMYHRRHYRRSRRAGHYNCSRHELHTHLERQACGMNGIGHNGRYR